MLLLLWLAEGALSFSLFSTTNVRTTTTTRLQAELTLSDVGTQEGLDWRTIGFEYRKTRCYMHYQYRDGAWDEGTRCEEPYLNIHVGATALHYGQSLFEGLKAFACEDGHVRLFRPEMNARRMRRGADRTLMASPDEDMFVEACRQAVLANLDYVPPYGSDGALYVRPLLVGSGPRIGLQPADAYDFLVIVTPVGQYYSGGLETIPAIVVGTDRAAPRGVGNVKLAGNYAPDLQPNLKSKKDGYPISLYLDSKSRTLVEEFSTSNFFGITKDGVYVTPDSDAVLPSITNDSLMQLAEANGIPVERRPVELTELENFDEVGACGTAVVVTPIQSITTPDTVYEFGEDPGPTCLRLYEQITSIQKGQAPDELGWMTDVI